MSCIELRSSIHTARKRHICEWCGGDIEPGSRYLCSAQVFDGDFLTLKAHMTCHTLVREYFSEQDCYDEGMSSDDFMDLVRDEYFQNHPDTSIITTPKERLAWVLESRGIVEKGGEDGRR